jgi:radical SAM protein with 4Fe4S-binding SPASM domain
VLNEDFSRRECISFGPFDREMVRYPTLAEIALTYGCQNRCTFCYASSPHRAGERRPMTTGQIMGVMDKILNQAHVPSLSFTGGEPTLHPDLPGLIRYGAGLGLRINLITNGIRTSHWEYAQSLVEAGLASAQVSLESADPRLHDEIVGRSGAHALTVAGVRNFQRLSIHVHTNTTLCAQNLDKAGDLIRFVARDLKLKTMSMNMVIRTGTALDQTRVGVTYTRVAERLPELLSVAEAEGIKLVWYSPIPYCIFNPVLFGLGAKSCACVDGILSVDPAGNVLPCSSFGDGIGSLVSQSFEDIYNSRRASYWRGKKFTPPACRDCPDVDVCGGGCPLYWDAAGSFDELPGKRASDPAKRRRWEKNRRRSRTFGVQPPGTGV